MRTRARDPDRSTEQASKNLEFRRHLLGVPCWMLTGVVYLALVFSTGYWRHLVPSCRDIVPESIRAVGT